MPNPYKLCVDLDETDKAELEAIVCAKKLKQTDVIRLLIREAYQRQSAEKQPRVAHG